MLLLGCALSLANACNLHYNLDSVEFRADGTSDATDTTDDGDSTDADTAGDDTSDTGPGDTSDGDTSRDDTADTAEDADSVNGDTADGDADIDCPIPEGDPDRTCPGDLGTVEGECDPLQCGECEQGRTCAMQLRFDGGQPDRFVASCVQDSELGNLSPGEECTSSGDCAGSALCVNWQSPDPRNRICSVLCDLQTGRGCEDGEFCTNPLAETLHGHGFCTPSCDPMASDPCPNVGETCAYDPNHPDETCKREFRCLEVGGGSSKSPGEDCTPAELHDDGCPSDMICVPVASSQASGACQPLCSDDGDCNAPRTCQSAPGGITTCQE